MAGGTGTDGQTCLEFVEQVELGGATVLEHGNVTFGAASSGVIGGLYSGVGFDRELLGRVSNHAFGSELRRFRHW